MAPCARQRSLARPTRSNRWPGMTSQRTIARSASLASLASSRVIDESESASTAKVTGSASNAGEKNRSASRTLHPATFRPTATVTVELDDEASEAVAVAWWAELTGRGGESMVVKPVEVVHRGPKGLTQPGIKCRGPEYLRII